MGYVAGGGLLYCTCVESANARVRNAAFDAEEIRWQQEIAAERQALLRESTFKRLADFSQRAKLSLNQSLMSLDTYPIDDEGRGTLEFLRAWRDHWDFSTGLILAGNYGFGKTTLQLALMHDLADKLIARKMSVRLVTALEFIRQLQRGFEPGHEPGESYDVVLENYQTCGLLFFDDLGAERMTEWVDQQFKLLIDWRYDKNLPMFMTTNLTAAEMKTHLDGRVFERLRETCDIIQVQGRNYRDDHISARAKARQGWE